MSLKQSLIGLTKKIVFLLFIINSKYAKLTKYAKSFHIWISVYTVISLYVYILRMSRFILHQLLHTLPSGAEPEIFQGRGDFVEFRHFNKHFV